MLSRTLEMSNDRLQNVRDIRSEDLANFNCNPVKTYVKIPLKSLFNLGQYQVGKQLNFGATELH